MKEQFEKLKGQLELQEWPALYMFKFIVPNEPEMIAKVGNLLSPEADLQLQASTNGKYMSVTGKEVMLTVDAVMEVYYKAAEIKGVIAL